LDGGRKPLNGLQRAGSDHSGHRKEKEMTGILTPLILALASGALHAAPAPLTVSAASKDAPRELQQYGRFVGSWSCQSESAQPDGSWEKMPGKARWSWYYVLDGHAVQDVWYPSPEVPGAAVGTNLRIYDAAAGVWRMVWATSQQGHFDAFRAIERDGQILMYGDRMKGADFPAHLARITFYNISDKHFDWKYESSGPADGRQWREVSRISCDRLAE
jgi:hypothetical protein